MVYVYIDINGKPHLVGQLWSEFSTGTEKTTFQYHSEWLANPLKFAIEPSMPLQPDPMLAKPDLRIFGCIVDSSQDAWCRKIIHYHANRKLYEINYVLSMDDFSRFGALRFRHTFDGSFLASVQEQIVPPIYELQTLMNATEDELELLINPPEELSMFRPKATIIDNEGNLLLAKFSQKADQLNYMLWEAVALTLAKNAKINVPKFFVQQICGNNVLFVTRFDRHGMKRLHYISGITMLNSRDDVQHCYLDLAQAIKQNCHDPSVDLHALWRRIVFNILISNFDDHLRNHGFIFKNGWSLAPLFDATPVPMHHTIRSLYTKIDRTHKDASLDVALSIADQFALDQQQAKSVIAEIAQASQEWRTIAKQFNIDDAEIEMMAQAFEHAELEKAKQY